MRTIRNLISMLALSAISCTVYAQGSKSHNCNLTGYKKASKDFVQCFKELGGCQSNKSEKLDKHCYCEAACFNVYQLSSDKTNSSQRTYLIEILEGLGRVGKEYWIVKKSGNNWVGVNYFTGYLSCITPTKNSNSDILFKSATDHGYVTIRLTPKGNFYSRQSIVDVEGTDVTKSNKQELIKKYSSRPESSDIGKFGE